ncbi:class I SAM-dependent methyltransferase [Streptomyces sp. NPDC001530]|uniref:class I SAM-dependent methyltransferase n=1 Tax=Streptomyces sp. NPDC001530 TaxID=3364582 RepID=UPI0036940961
MALGHLLHGSHDPAAPGALGNARGYELFCKVVLFGRRRRMYGQLVALSGARPGDRVLDVGCGPGYLTRMMARAVAPDGSALGVDAAPTMIGYAIQHTRESHCTFVQGLGEALDLADSSFDVVVTSLAVHHIPADKRARAVEEMYRVLRPGGRVLIADFRPPSGRTAWHLVGRAAGPEMAHNPIHILGPLAESAGFTELSGGDVRPFLAYVRGVKP